MFSSIRSFGTTFYDDFINPVLRDFSSPIRTPLKKGYKSLQGYWHAPSLQDKQKHLEEFITTALRISLSALSFMAYRSACRTGEKYLGLFGKTVAFGGVYLLGSAIDTAANRTSTSSWFLYNGTLGMLRSFGSSWSAMFCLLLVRDPKSATDQPTRDVFSRPLIKDLIQKVAAKCTGNKEPLRREVTNATKQAALSTEAVLAQIDRATAKIDESLAASRSIHDEPDLRDSTILSGNRPTSPNPKRDPSSPELPSSRNSPPPEGFTLFPS